MSVLLGLWLARPVTANAPYNQSDYSDDIIKDNAIIRNEIPNVAQTQQNGLRGQRPASGRHSTRAEKTISEERLRAYLEAKGSPLSNYVRDILSSPYWSTIIGICTIEQYGCTRAPGNNYWGIMDSKGTLAKYATLSDGIEAISSLLARYEAKGKDTLEELNGYYVVPASTNWLNTVIRTKLQLESL